MNRLRELRAERAMAQVTLADAVGLSRQALHALESGKSVPGVDVALRLAAVLGVTVEKLFSSAAAEARVVARLAGPAAPGAGARRRVALARVNEAWVAHPLTGRDTRAADGLFSDGAVEPLSSLARAQRRLLVMGCAPALGLLAARLGDDVPLTWLPGGSRAALEALARGDVHIAGIHHGSDDQRAGLVRSVLPKTPALRVTLADWELGLVVARGNPKRLRATRDLAKPGVRVVLREAGSGARTFLEDALKRERVPWSRVKTVTPLASGHLEVAERVALGAADTGITIGAAAVAFDLDFIPLIEERFELVIPRSLVRDERVERLVDVLASAPFRRELAQLGGYFTAPTGASK